MSTMKPEAGQWWFCCKKPGVTAKEFGLYIHTVLPNGVIVAEVNPGEYELESEEDIETYEHEPRCTGWDWVVPEPQPAEDPDEWVILDPVKYADHVPRVGIDQFEGAGKDVWITQENNHTSQKVGAFFESCGAYHRCKRRDLPKVEQVEQWPKYYHASFKANQIAFVRRDSFHQYTPVMHDGTELKQQPWFGDDNCRIKLTEAEAMALIQKPQPQPQKTRVRLFASEFGDITAAEDHPGDEY